MPLFIDLPNADIQSFSVMIAGWVAGDRPATQIELLANGTPVNFFLYDRPDLVAAHPGQPVRTGVCAWLNLLAIEPAGALTIAMRYGDEFVRREVGIGGSVLEGLPRQRGLREATRVWIGPRLRCPQCRAPNRRLRVDPREIACSRCGAVFAQDSAAVNMISPTLGLTSNLSHSARPSSNPYDPQALSVIASTTEAGGWVLDCGAGARPERLANVVNVEIEDYFSTDVLAVGESLPFEDAVFDSVISLAVLEHVRSPFVCATELLRVLKPGGTLMCSVPFLQPVHGYPNHYYNMTQQGLRNLFAEDAEILACFVPAHGHPIFALNWFVREYLGGLDNAAREEVAGMTLAQIAAMSPIDYVNTPIARALSQQAQDGIACLNTVIARKL